MLKLLIQQQYQEIILNCNLIPDIIEREQAESKTIIPLLVLKNILILLTCVSNCAVSEIISTLLKHLFNIHLNHCT